jgi:hypothetical protein
MHLGPSISSNLSTRPLVANHNRGDGGGGCRPAGEVAPWRRAVAVEHIEALSHPRGSLARPEAGQVSLATCACGCYGGGPTPGCSGGARGTALGEDRSEGVAVAARAIRRWS